MTENIFGVSADERYRRKRQEETIKQLTKRVEALESKITELEERLRLLGLHCDFPPFKGGESSRQ